MREKIFIAFLFIATLSSQIFAQCSYNLIDLQHIDCYNDNTGEIDISITNSNVTYWWIFPDGSTSTNSILSNLVAGDYTLNIMENSIPGDTSSSVICFLSDTISVYQTIEITAEFFVQNNCYPTDSADVSTNIYGGTPPYSTLWTASGDTSRNLTNIPSSNTPYTLSVIDANGCQNNQFLFVNPVQNIQTFMSINNVICKDDNSGSARIYVEYGTPPFTFTWSNGEIFIDENASQIDNLYPGIYSVEIQDTMGCIALDSVEISTNPDVCLTVYKVFSPNEDGINDFWEIKNIHLYPEALVEVYDQLGNRIYRRRNYINSSSVAFNGKLNERRLPSGTYYYIVDLENGDEVLKGTLNIIR